MTIKMKSSIVLYFFILLHGISWSAQVVGTLKYHAGQELKLKGFKGTHSYTLDSNRLDNEGNFRLNYPSGYQGMGYLEFSTEEQLLLVLAEPLVTIKGNHILTTDSLTIESQENDWLTIHGIAHNRREQAFSGWKYLQSIYQQEKKWEETEGAIQQEIQRLEQEGAEAIERLNPDYYVSWYLPKRKMLQEISLSAQRYTERIPKHIHDFRNIDFTDKRMYHSGLIIELMESHYWLLENMGASMDSIYTQMNRSTDYLLHNLESNNELFNEVTEYLFDYLEKRSLFRASEHLALAVLNQNSCTLNNELANQLETYRAMKVGNTAPDLLFKGFTIQNQLTRFDELSLTSLNNSYTLLVFGASWCPKCVTEIPEITTNYQELKSKGMEVVFISLDTDTTQYVEFASKFPWVSTCDFKGWDSPLAKKYYINGTPTLFLLDKELKIKLRPLSVAHVKAWVAQNL